MPNARAWLTPDNPPGQNRAVVLYVPTGEEYEQAVRGALVELVNPDNWQQSGTLTPEETAAYFEEALFLTMQWIDAE